MLALKSWASRSRAGKGFYVADTGVSPFANGMALAGDRIGAASFISLAGLISVTGYSGSAYVMGWIGGYFLLGLVLANPEIAGLPNWVLALVIAGGLIASLSLSTGLLLIVASSVSYDFYSRVINKRATEKQRAFASRIAAATTVVLAGYLGVHPPATVAQVAAYAFGLAAASFFPVLILGIFWSRATSQGAIAGMIAGTAFTAFYIVQVGMYHSNPWFFGISPEGIGAVGMMLNFVVAYVVSRFTPAPPPEIRELVETIRYPREVLRP